MNNSNNKNTEVIQNIRELIADQNTTKEINKLAEENKKLRSDMNENVKNTENMWNFITDYDLVNKYFNFVEKGEKLP